MTKKLLTLHEIVDYALRFDQVGSRLDESLLLEKIEGDDIKKIGEANQELQKTLQQLDNAFQGRVKTLDDEIKKILDGVNKTDKVLQKAMSGDGLSSSKLMAKITKFFRGEEDPKATINAVLLLQSRAQELVEILKFCLPKIVERLEAAGVDKKSADPFPKALRMKDGIALKAMKEILSKGQPGLFKKVGNFFKSLNVNKSIIDPNEKVNYDSIAQEFLELKVSDIFDINDGVDAIKTDKGEDLKTIVQDNQGALKGSKKEETGEDGGDAAGDLGVELEEPTEQEAEKEVEAADANLKAAEDKAEQADEAPGVTLANMLDDWAESLSKSSQDALKAKNRLGDLKDIVGIALDDASKAVEDEVSAAVQAWRDDHEETLMKSKRFAKKNFVSLQQTIPRIAGLMLKKKTESQLVLTKPAIHQFVRNYLDRKFNTAGMINESSRWQLLAGIKR